MGALGALDELRRGLDVFGLGAARRAASEAPRRTWSRSRRRAWPRERRRLRRGRPAPRRDRGPGVGGARRRRATTSSCRERDPRPRLRAATPFARRCAVAEQCSRCGRASVPSATLDWLGEGAAPAGAARARADRGRGLARPPGDRRVVRAVSLRRRLGARGGGAPAALLPRPGHRPPQPRCGRAERGRGGRDGRRPPRARRGRRHAGRLPRVRGGRRAPSGRRRPQPRPVPRRGEGDRLWAYAAAADGDTPVWDLDLTDGAAFVLGAEGKGCARSCGEPATRPSRSRSIPGSSR